MRCYICDRVIESPNYNEDHKDFEPCETCMAVISDLVEGDKDNVTAADDDLALGDSTDIYLSWVVQEGYPDDHEDPDYDEYENR